MEPETTTPEASPETITLLADDWKQYQAYVAGLEEQTRLDGLELERLRPIAEKAAREQEEREKIEVRAPGRFSWSKAVAFALGFALCAANGVFIGLFINMAFAVAYVWILVGLAAVSLIISLRSFYTRAFITPIIFTAAVGVALIVTSNLTQGYIPASADEYVLSATSAEGEPVDEWAVVILDSAGNEKFRQPMTDTDTYMKYGKSGLMKDDTIVVQSAVPGTKCFISLDGVNLSEASYADPGPLDCRYTYTASK